MKSEYRKGSHTVTRLTCHLVWATKYRYQVLRGDVQVRCRELLIQICEAEGVEILKGVISSDHVHMHIEYAPKTSLSMLLKQMKGRTSRKLQQEFPKLDQLIPQYHIASYLGISQTQLSRIRNQIKTKK